MHGRTAAVVLAIATPLWACGDRGGSGDARAGSDTAQVRSGDGAGTDGAGTSAGDGDGVDRIESADAATRPPDPDVEAVRLARAAIASVDIPLYPGARALDATEFEANTAPFIAAEFFSLDPPGRVAAFYDRELRSQTRRRNTTLEPGVVRYEFERAFSGLAVKPWDPDSTDRAALLARFDRRDAQGVTSAELDAYGDFLRAARTQVVVNVPRPEPR